MATDKITVLAAEILFRTQDALEKLKRLDSALGSTAEKIKFLKDLIKQVAAEMKGDLQGAVAAVSSIASKAGINPNLVKSIGKELQLFDGIAKKTLGGVETQTAGAATRMTLLGNAIQQMAIKGKTSIEQVVATLRLLNESKGTQFGKFGFTDKELTDTLAALQKIQQAMGGGVQAPSKGGMISNYVKQNFGDINQYIAQSQNKIEAWKNVVRGAAQAAGVSFEEAGRRLKGMVSGTTVAPLQRALKELGQDGRSSLQKLVDGFHFVRIALGALVSMLLFQAIQAFGQMVNGALKGLTEIEAAMFNIVNAEKRLSQQGVEITVPDLQVLIEQLQELDPMLSRFQATELVSSLATKVAPALGLTTKEIESLAKSITVLAVRNQALGKSFEEVESQVITGLLSGRVTSGINQLGTKITEQAVQEEVLNMRLAENEKAYKALNSQEKERVDALAIISILEKNTAEEMENIPAFLKTASGEIGVLRATWQDFLTSIGQDLAPLFKALLESAIILLQRTGEWLDKNKEGLSLAVNSAAAFVTFLNQATGYYDAFNERIEKSSPLIKGIIARFGELLKTISRVLPGLAGLSGALDFKKGIENLTKLKGQLDGFIDYLANLPESVQKFLGIPPNIKQQWDEFFGNFEYADTPTADIKELLETAEDTAEAVKAMEKLADAIEEVAIDARHAREDLAIALQQKKADIEIGFEQKNTDTELEALQKSEDAVIDYNNKVADINLDAQQKVADAKRKAREDELKAERDLLQKLKELREQFLLDLEDALHERDARQVLRLIKEYQFNKQNIIDRKKMEDEERRAKLAADLRNIEIERQQRLASAAIDRETTGT
jgi:hypothetical protein